MEIRQTMEKLRQDVLSRQAVLGQIFSTHKSTSVLDYANQWKVPAAGPGEERLGRFLTDRVSPLLERLYPKEAVLGAVAQLKSFPLVSTIDHHGLLNHPFFINSNLVFSLNENNRYLICLSTSGVSLNNSSWPGCLLYSGQGGLKRYSFFPDKLKTAAVLSVPAMESKAVKKVVSQICRDEGLATSTKEFLAGLVEKIFADVDARGFSRFSDQAAVLSSALWKEIFPEAPTLLYLPLEDLVTEVLLRDVLPDPDHVLHRLFFTSEGWDLVENHFSGSLGAFTSAHKGSFLFWGINKSGRRIHLVRSGDGLKGLPYPLSPEAGQFSGLLKGGQLYPTTLVCFLVMIYYRITCAGGFNQVNWLTGIKRRFIKLLAAMGEEDLATEAGLAVTDNFAETDLAFLESGGALYKAAGIDLFLRQDRGLFGKYRALAGQVTMGESIETMLPEIYKVITPAGLRKPDLLAVSAAEIARLNGVEQKAREMLAR